MQTILQFFPWISKVIDREREKRAAYKVCHSLLLTTFHEYENMYGHFWNKWIRSYYDFFFFCLL